MALNGNTGSRKSSSQDYMNLLYSDSDSDRVPDLKLPPIKGKKQKRKKTFGGRHDESHSNAWMVLKFIIGLICVTAVVISAGICFWSLQRIKELQEQIDSLQSSKKVDSELLKFQTQLTSVNKTLTDLRTGDGNLSDIKQTLSAMQEKLKMLEGTTQTLQETVKDSKTILDIPNKYNELANDVAQMGSEFSAFKKEQTDKNADVEKRLAQLESHSDEGNMASSSQNADQVDTQYGQMLSQQLASYNDSTNAGFISVRQELEKLGARVSTLEKFTQTMTGSSNSDLDTEKVTALVTSLIDEKMANSSSDSQESNNVPTKDKNLAELSQQVQIILDEVEKIQHTQDYVEKGDFLAFKELTLVNIEHINETILTLDSEFDAIAQRFGTLETAVANVSVAIDVNKGHKSDHLLNEVEVSTTTTIAPESGEKVRKTGLHIDDINTTQDLHKAFTESWPTTKDGLLDIKELNKLLGDSALDTALLTDFDENKDGLYSEEEMANALDISSLTKGMRV